MDKPIGLVEKAERKCLLGGEYLIDFDPTDGLERVGCSPSVEVFFFTICEEKIREKDIELLLSSLPQCWWIYRMVILISGDITLTDVNCFVEDILGRAAIPTEEVNCIYTAVAGETSEGQRISIWIRCGD